MGKSGAKVLERLAVRVQVEVKFAGQVYLVEFRGLRFH